MLHGMLFVDTLPSTAHYWFLCSGQKEHLLCEEPDPRDPNNVVYCGYCHNHYKKMVCEEVYTRV